MNFKEWLFKQSTLLHEKAILIPDGLDAKIRQLIPQFLKDIKKARDEKSFLGSEPVDLDFIRPDGRETTVQIYAAYDDTTPDYARTNRGQLIINAKYWTDEILTPLNLYKKIVHEFIHVLDPKMSLRKNFPYNYKTAHQASGSEYITQPHEFDADSGQVANSIYRMGIALMQKGDLQIAQTLVDQTKKFLANPRSKQMGEPLHKILVDSDTWSTINVYLRRPKLWKKFAQRIYYEVERLQDLLKTKSL